MDGPDEPSSQLDDDAPSVPATADMPATAGSDDYDDEGAWPALSTRSARARARTGAGDDAEKATLPNFETTTT